MDSMESRKPLETWVATWATSANPINPMLNTNAERVNSALTTPEKNHLLIALQLEELQAKENEGRWISCIRNVIFHLRRGEVENAKIVCHNDGDKMEAYPEIIQYIIANLYEKGEQHPWFFSSL